MEIDYARVSWVEERGGVPPTEISFVRGGLGLLA